jgi:hemerythrin
MIEWNSDLEIGDQAIDFQHKKLISLINDIDKVKDQGEESQMIIEITLDELKKYTSYHFSEEEAMLEKVGYPKLEEHKVEHRLFIDKIDQFSERFKDEGDKMITDLLTYLYGWLTSHIKVKDMDYKSSLEGS